MNEESRITFAKEVTAWLRDLRREKSVRIERVAIDAPSDYCSPDLSRRRADQALDEAGIDCFATPSRNAFQEKIKAAREHLDNGGVESEMPNANQLWMLVGFDLFNELKGTGYDCVETYPQAIARQINCSSKHKSTKEGFAEQIERTAFLIGYSVPELHRALDRMGFGSSHDRLDAFLSSWVASLPEHATLVYGEAPSDAILVPKIEVVEKGCLEKLVAVAEG